MVVAYKVDPRGRVIDVQRMRRSRTFTPIAVTERTEPQRETPTSFARGIAAAEFSKARRRRP